MAVQVTIQTGFLITPAPAAADATGNYCVPAAGSNGVLIEVLNTGAGASTVTLDDVASVSPPNALTFNPDVQQAVPATTGKRVFRVKDVSRFKDPVTGRVSWSYDVVTGVTVNVYEL